MKVLAMLLPIFCYAVLYAQVNDKKNSLDSLYPFKKAALFSSVLPGAGQIYNSIHHNRRKHAFWKVPLIYTGLGLSAWFITQNQQKIQSLRKEYAIRQVSSPTDPTWVNYDDFALIALYDQYAQRRDFSILAMSAIYVIQVFDAAVEAHFLNFNVSPDLSLELRPFASPWTVGCTASFHLMPTLRK